MIAPIVGCVEEAVCNAAKHARANESRVQTERGDDHVQATITDDG